MFSSARASCMEIPILWGGGGGGGLSLSLSRSWLLRGPPANDLFHFLEC